MASRIIIFSVSMLVLGIGGGGCVNQAADHHEGEKKMPANTIEDVLKQQTDRLMSLPGVVGTAQGLCEGKPCIKVYVVKMTPELEQQIPNVLSGYPVVVQVTGEIKALGENRN